MNWNNLSLKQKADIIKMSVQSGITDLSEIQQLYNDSQISTRQTEKALGGTLKKNKFQDGGQENNTELTREQKINYLSNLYYKSDLEQPYSKDNPNDFISPIYNNTQLNALPNDLIDLIYNNFSTKPNVVYSEFQKYPMIGYAPLRLRTYYPLVSSYPFTGHSVLSSNNGSNNITSYFNTKGYNLLTNNCSDTTRKALETVFEEPLDYYFFTTPGDVQDFAIEHGGKYNNNAQERGRKEVIIPMNERRYNNWRRYLHEYRKQKYNYNVPLNTVTESVNKFEDGGTIEPVDYETPWGITTRSRYRGEHTAPTSAIYFKSKEDRDAYAAQQDIDLYGGVLPELEVTAKGVPIEEKPTTQRNTYADIFYNMSDWDSLFGPPRVNTNKNAWQKNPEYMQNWTDSGNAAAAFTVAPFATAAAVEYALPWLSENIFPYLSARGWLAATQAAGNTPAWLTPTSAAAIDATLAGTATGASINDMIENGPTFENVLGTALGGIGLAYEAYPTIMNGIQSGRRAYNTFRLNRQLNKAATSFDGTVGADYFRSPSNWYRITESPEIMDLRYQGKNITTDDIFSYNSPSNDFRSFVLENQLSPGTGANEGYWMMPRKKKFIDLIKEGSAHGNTSQAAKGQIWGSTVASSKKFPQYIIEGEGPAEVFRGFNPATGADSRTHFVQVPWEEVPVGARIGFHTGEMPMEGLRAFRQLPNGRYQYEGPILQDKIIRVEESPLDNLNNILGGDINKFGEGGQKIEVRRSVNGVTTPEVLGTFNNEDEYNNWLQNNNQYTEVPNNFITEATALLPELTITSNKDNTTSTNMGSYSDTRRNTNYSFRDWWNSIPSSLNRQWNNFLQYDPIIGQSRIDNYRRAESMFPNLSQKYDVLNNAIEAVNMGTNGFLNRLSPTQNISLLIDAFQGDNILNSWYGNSGIVSDNFANSHPFLATAINGIADWGLSRYSPAYLRTALRSIDRAGVRNTMNQSAPNTLNRLIGTGTSGYEDALSSGIIRGNQSGGFANAKQLRKFLNYLKEIGITDENILRNVASNNLTQKDFNLLKSKVTNSRFSYMLEDYDTYQDYLNFKEWLRNNSKLYTYTEDPNQWSYSWNGNAMATFAEPGEVLGNSASIFPGDFGVQITNSPRYLQRATEFGHFYEHPTTRYPLNITNPDVHFYVRKDGLLTGTKYMSEVPYERVLLDQLRLRNGQPILTQPRIVNSPLFKDGIPNMNYNIPLVPKYYIQQDNTQVR